MCLPLFPSLYLPGVLQWKMINTNPVTATCFLTLFIMRTIGDKRAKYFLTCFRPQAASSETIGASKQKLWNGMIAVSARSSPIAINCALDGWLCRPPLLPNSSISASKSLNDVWDYTSDKTAFASFMLHGRIVDDIQGNKCLMDAFLTTIGPALWLGILTSISPCPLATNIAAIS